MAPSKEALRSQQPSVTLEGEEQSQSQSLVKQGERSILSAEGTLRGLVIVEFDARINAMQNDITKNVMTAISGLI